MEQDKKERLLTAAIKLFSEHGYEQVSIRQLAQASGLNSAMISYYFGGKEKLYVSVLQDYLHGLLKDTQGITPAYRQALTDALAGAVQLAERAVAEHGEKWVRQAATALYNCTTAIAMAWEACKTGSQERLRLSQLVIAHRVLPRDPLHAGGVPAEWLQ